MIIHHAKITGFRNLADVELDFAPGVNLILGANGQGKTNLLEALHFIALGRSHRGARDEDLVAFGGDSLHVALQVEIEGDANGVETGGKTASDKAATDETTSDETTSDETAAPAPPRTIEFEFGIERGGGRRFKVDGEIVARRADLVGLLAAVYFDPETVRLVREGPEHRRRFVDRGLSQIDPRYLAALTAYHRALRQKTRILHEIKQRVREPGKAREEVDSWNRELARHAAGVVLGRAEYASLLGRAATRAHRAVVGGEDGLEFTYHPCLESARWKGIEGVTEGLTESSVAAPGDYPETGKLIRDIYAEFDYIWPDELRRGRPLTGPHRDDFGVRLAGRSLRTYGSQGETRTAAVALILAQSEVVHERRRVRPVLFLDDIFSELDRERARRLQELAAAEHQLFVATARHDDVAGWRPPDRKVWWVAQGALSADQETADEDSAEEQAADKEAADKEAADGEG